MKINKERNWFFEIKSKYKGTVEFNDLNPIQDRYPICRIVEENGTTHYVYSQWSGEIEYANVKSVDIGDRLAIIKI